MVDDFSIDRDAWAKPKPFGISGCFRLRNESEYMEAAVLSHLPYLDEAVLVVQPSDDDTVERAHKLADEHAKVNVYLYPFMVDWIGTEGFYQKDMNAPGHLVHMSNWALTRCRYSWIAKTEGDVICLSSFQRIVDLVHEFQERMHYYGRYILNIAGKDHDLISLENPRNGGDDEAGFRNHPHYSFTRSGKWEDITAGPRAAIGWSALHTKRCKRKHWDGWNGETWIPWTRENVRFALEKFNRWRIPYWGQDDPLGAEVLYEETLITEAK